MRLADRFANTEIVHDETDGWQVVFRNASGDVKRVVAGFDDENDAEVWLTIQVLTGGRR